MVAVLTLDQKNLRRGTIEDLKRRTCTWVHLEEPTDDELAPVLVSTDLTFENIKELLAKTQRPVLRDVKNYSLVVFRSPLLLPKIGTKPIVFLISKTKNDLISICGHHSSSLERVSSFPEHRLKEIFAQGATRLLFAAIDEIIHSYHNFFDHVDDAIAQIENEMRKPNAKQTVSDRIYLLKKDLILFHKALIGNREVVGGIERSYASFIDPELLSDFRILRDDLVQLIEFETTYRDVLTSTLEVHLTTVSNALNLTMKRLSGWGAIILVPSLIAGIFGMNFEIIPTAKDPHGFITAVVIMIVAVGALYWYFKKQDWI